MSSSTAHRDPRLDFFRGIAMLIIYIAHVPYNTWADWIPARFGLSDATEMFVFCSGYAAAIAFGGTFVKSGFQWGTIRIGYRIWQIYIAHIGMFAVIASMVAFATVHFGDVRDYVQALELGWFFKHPVEGLAAYLSLTYVPFYFDILPMYIGCLFLVPPIMALSKIDRRLPLAASALLYASVWAFHLGFPADPAGTRHWFFNPLAWQLLFFTGFSISRGWIRVPRPDRRVAWAVAAALVVLAPFANYEFAENYTALRVVRDLIWPWIDKSDFAILRYVHFLALAYVAVAALHGRVHVLHGDWARPFLTVGRNALPVFMLSMGLARVAEMVLDRIGYGAAQIALANLGGLAILIGFAYWCTMLKREPWKKIAADRAAARAAELAPRFVGGAAPAE